MWDMIYYIKGETLLACGKSTTNTNNKDEKFIKNYKKKNHGFGLVVLGWVGLIGLGQVGLYWIARNWFGLGWVSVCWVG